jgi:hypothetical protein
MSFASHCLPRDYPSSEAPTEAPEYQAPEGDISGAHNMGSAPRKRYLGEGEAGAGIEVERKPLPV